MGIESMMLACHLRERPRSLEGRFYVYPQRAQDKCYGVT